MSIFSASAFDRDQLPQLENDQLILRLPRVSDYYGWAELRLKSAEFLKPFEPKWPQDYHVQRRFKERVKRYRRDAQLGRGYSFLIYRKDACQPELVGGITLTNVRLGAAMSVSLGYWIGAPFARRGHMSRAVQLVKPFVFDQLNLHRIEASCLLHNRPSIRLLEKSGFIREGCASKYLLINAKWQDHWLYGLHKEQYLTIKGD